MARALNQIIKELDTVYNPQRDVYNKSLKALPGEIEAENKGLEATKTDAFGQIVTGANRRGVAFGGIPLDEQAKYLGSTYLPAVANLRNRFKQKEFSLQDALAQLTARQYEQAYGIRQNELDREEQAAARAAAARAASAGPSFSGFGGYDDGGQVQGAVGGYGFQQRKDKGFNFVDEQGQPISAAKYAAAVRMPFRQLLQMMADKGDRGARAALGFVGDDFGYNPNDIGGNTDLYNSLVWGTGLSASSPRRASSGGGGW